MKTVQNGFSRQHPIIVKRTVKPHQIYCHILRHLFPIRSHRRVACCRVENPFSVRGLQDNVVPADNPDQHQRIWAAGWSAPFEHLIVAIAFASCWCVWAPSLTEPRDGVQLQPSGSRAEPQGVKVQGNTKLQIPPQRSSTPVFSSILKPGSLTSRATYTPRDENPPSMPPQSAKSGQRKSPVSIRKSPVATEQKQATQCTDRIKPKPRLSQGSPSYPTSRGEAPLSKIRGEGVSNFHNPHTLSCNMQCPCPTGCPPFHSGHAMGKELLGH